jgi:hypothetical protein
VHEQPCQSVLRASLSQHVIAAVTIPLLARSGSALHDDYVDKRKTLEQGEEGYLGRVAVAPSRHTGTSHRSLSPSHRWSPRYHSERKFACATDRTRAPRRSYYQAVCTFSFPFLWPRLMKDTDFRPNSNGRPEGDPVRNKSTSLLNR